MRSRPAEHLRHRRLHWQAGAGARGQCHGRRRWVETIAGAPTMPIPADRYTSCCAVPTANRGGEHATEAQAKEKGFEIKVGKFFMPNGKAQGLNAKVGFVKIIADAKYARSLAHLVGPSVTELLSASSLAQMMEITPAEIARNVHAHPTLSEVFHGGGARG